MKAEDARRLKGLERENGQLRLVADKELENLALKELAEGKWWARAGGERRSWFFRTASTSPGGGHARSSASREDPAL